MDKTYTFEELRKMAKSFLDRLPGASVESIDAGWKMFAVAYLNTKMSDLERNSAAPALYRVVHREYITAVEAAN